MSVINEEMESMATIYFKDLYTEDASVKPDITTNTLHQKVDELTNEGLCANLTDEEISFSIFKIGPRKAPRPDGYPACFISITV